MEASTATSMTAAAPLGETRCGSKYKRNECDLQ
jgi:hypothetical protein